MLSSTAEQSPGNNFWLLLNMLLHLSRLCCSYQDGQVTVQLLLLLTVAQQSRAEPKTHLLLDVDYFYLPRLSHLCRRGQTPSLAFALCSNCRTRLKCPLQLFKHFWDACDTHNSDLRLATWLSHLCLNYAILGHPIHPTSGADLNTKQETCNES